MLFWYIFCTTCKANERLWLMAKSFHDYPRYETESLPVRWRPKLSKYLTVYTKTRRPLNTKNIHKKNWSYTEDPVFPPANPSGTAISSLHYPGNQHVVLDWWISLNTWTILKKSPEWYIRNARSSTTSIRNFESHNADLCDRRVPNASQDYHRTGVPSMNELTDSSHSLKHLWILHLLFIWIKLDRDNEWGCTSY